MAKLTLPLGSSSASGQLGKSWVYFPWKGLNLVRTLVIPANPNTAAQAAQRGTFTAAVLAYHLALFTARDVAGWRRYALQLAAVMTYFNAFVRQYILAINAGGIWETLNNMVVSLPGPGVFTITVDCIANSVGLLYWGTTPGYMPTTVVAIYAPGPPPTYTFNLVGLPAATQIYFWATNTAPLVFGRTGIHMERST